MSISTLYHQFVGQAYDKQVYLADSIGVQHQWAFDIQKGTVTFNQQLTFSVQIVGTHSTESNTWLWAWANEASNLPAGLIQDSLKVKAFGEEHNIEPLSQAELAVTDAIDGTRLTTIASGLCDARCSYRGSYPGGELYLLIQDERFIRRISDPINRIIRLFPEMLTVIPVSRPRVALVHYAKGYGLTVDERENDLYISGQAGALLAQFESATQFTSIERQ